MKIRSIFFRILLNVLLPLIIVFFLIAYLSYSNISRLHKANQERELNQIQQEIKGLILNQNQTFDLIEKLFTYQTEDILEKISSSFSKNTDNFTSVDLDSILKVYNLEAENADLYVNDAKIGIIINTTFKPDLGLNLFSYGQNYKNFLLDIAKNKQLILGRLTMEVATKRLKSYSYLATADSKYILEMGLYSKEADNYMRTVKQRIDSLTSNQRISELDVIVDPSDPFSIYNNRVFEDNDSLNNEVKIVKWVMENNKDSIIHLNNITKYYTYYYNDALGDLVLRVIYDHTSVNKSLLHDVIANLILFAFGIIVLVLILAISIRKITYPILKLTKASIEVSKGDLSQRIEVKGSDEVSILAKTFNEMVFKIDSSSNQLIYQKKVVENKNQEILDSILYAKRIQEAILPTDDIFKKSLPNSFVFFKPKDIVAGDFYWLTEIEGKVIVTAADCTGHGVPGAFMSMLGVSFLNDIVNKEYITHPGVILRRLRKEVINALQQKGTYGEQRDGMDIALCSIDFNTLELQFSGANNPLYIIRKKEYEAIPNSIILENSEYILYEIKGDKMPIGIHERMDKFQMHEIQLIKGDCIYLFSDGYPDQFGGEDGKKFKYKPFKSLLLNNVSKSMSEQTEILENTLKQWKGNFDQVDDVIIVGIKI